MRGTRLSRLAVLGLAIATVGLWVVGCTDQHPHKLLLPTHGVQTAPSGDYSLAWSDVEVVGTGRIVLPGETDLTLGAAQVKDLAHSLFNISAADRHGWEVTTRTDENGAAWLAVDPHPHGAAKFLVPYDEGTGRAEGYFLPAAFPAPSAAGNALMKAFIARTTGIQNLQDVNVTTFGLTAANYAFHWRPDALEFEPVEIAYPSLIAQGLTIEGTFFVGETQGSFSATIDRVVGDARGVQVTECPECAAMPGKPGGRPPVGVDP